MIYYIYDKLNNAVKIGYAKNVKARFSSYLTHNINPLLLVHIENGDINAEKEIHVKYKNLTIKTEWFKCEKDLLKKLIEEYGEDFTKIKSENYTLLNDTFFRNHKNAGLTEYKINNRKRIKHNRKKYEEKKLRVKVEKTYNELDKHFVKRKNSMIPTKDLSNYLLVNNIKSKYGEKNLPVKHVAEYFDVQMKKIMINKKRQMYVVGLDYAQKGV